MVMMPTSLPFFDHREVADPIVGHDAHQLLERVIRAANQDGAGHQVADFERLGLAAVQGHAAHDVALGQDAAIFWSASTTTRAPMRRL